MTKKDAMQAYHDGINAVVDLVTVMSTKIDDLSSQITDLKEQNIKQEQRIAELEARLNKNSNNSSKPPSSDGYGKAPQNSRQRSGRLPGGQPGHPGRTLDKVANPDEVIEYKIPDICDCGHNLIGEAMQKKTRQVFDFPKVRIRVTEHVTYEVVCPICGRVHKTQFPVNVTQPVQYGENMQTLMNYFTQYQLLPLERTCETLKHITQQNISEGTLVNAAHVLYEKLKIPVQEIKEQVTKSEVTHFDETGMRSEGKTQWMHVASTENLTYYAMHGKRGEKAARDIGILPDFKGTAVHDHWKPYYRFTDCTHAECNSHHLRSLKDVVENYHQEWAENMAALLVEIHHRVEALKVQGIPQMEQEELQLWQGQYHSIVSDGITEDSQKSTQMLNRKGKPKKSKPLQLLLKLQQYDIETLAFMYDFDVPFDNNLAERDIRMQKLRQKISGSFRGKEGGQVFCRIRSYLSTAGKNGIDAMEAITRAIKGQPFVPECK